MSSVEGGYLCSTCLSLASDVWAWRANARLEKYSKRGRHHDSVETLRRAAEASCYICSRLEASVKRVDDWELTSTALVFGSKLEYGRHFFLTARKG